MNFYTTAGQMALGTRLRQLADVFMGNAEQIYRLYEVDLDPRWFPVFYMLTVKDSAGITELANDIGQTHPAVSQVVKSMMARDIVTTEKCPEDARVNRVTLTDKGKRIAENLAVQCIDVEAAVKNMLSMAGSNLWSELDAIEREMEQKSFYDRVIETRKAREQANVEIIDYQPKYKKPFKDLNVAWIETYWDMEPADYKILDNPKDIINQGGYIAVALYQGNPVGVCALVKMNDESYELAKMAVSDAAKGIGIGKRLGQHMIEKARSLGAKRVYLESNTILEPAINLYHKLGFQRVSGQDSPYQRCNIQMELLLKD